MPMPECLADEHGGGTAGMLASRQMPFCALLLIGLFSAGLAPAASPPQQLAKIAADYAARMVDQSPYLQMLEGRRVAAMPVHTWASARKNADYAKAQLAALASLNEDELGDQERLTLAMLERELRMSVEGLDHHWHDFGVTPYKAGFTLSGMLPAALASAPLASGEDLDIYLGLLADIGRFADDHAARLQAQAERGIRLPKPALPGARATFQSFRDGLPGLAALDESRVASLSEEQASGLQAGVESLLEETALPALDRLLAAMGEAYEKAAPEAVGLGQYPGGDAAYRFAIRKQTTLDLDPADIHKRGLIHLSQIQERMQAVRDRLGFEGTAAAFHAQMRKDPRFFAETPEEVAQRYMAHIRRIEPLIPRYFSVRPLAPYGVERLDPAAEAGMTFGYYQPPNIANPTGNYRFNGSSLEQRPMVWTGPLIYHELVPGHHFHIALQRENPQLGPFRAKTALLYAAYTEGWANYAASLGNEMGLFQDPYEEYGWLLFDSFLSARLVLDTGMNRLGWSLEKARAFMRENTFSGESEIATETLRYSTDMPAQALAYKLGYEKIWHIRQQQEKRLGDSFDIRAFHAAVLGSGAMPMPLLERHVRAVMEANP